MDYFKIIQKYSFALKLENGATCLRLIRLSTAFHVYNCFNQGIERANKEADACLEQEAVEIRANKLIL